MRKSDPARYAQSEAEGVDSFNRFTQRVIVWGCDDVLRQFSKWKLSMYAVVFEMEKLFFAIRKDMGHKNAGLRRGDILRIFTPDEERASPEAAPSASPTTPRGDR